MYYESHPVASLNRPSFNHNETMITPLLLTTVYAKLKVNSDHTSIPNLPRASYTAQFHRTQIKQAHTITISLES